MSGTNSFLNLATMVRFRVDRKFLTKKDSDLIDFLGIIGSNISTKPAFSSIATKGTQLLTMNEIFETNYTAVLEGDRRKISMRDKAKVESLVLARNIADDVNDLADGDQSVIEEAGFNSVSEPSKDRPMGSTTLISVEYLSGLYMLRLRCKKADRAVDYQIDVSTDNITWEEGIDSMPLTLFKIKWKKPKGAYFIRICPRDRNGNRGTPSNFLPVTIY